MIPGLSTSTVLNLKVAGYPSPEGAGYPFPGSSTITLQTTPLPVTFLGQGGGIRMADIPIGFCAQDLLTPVETSTGTVIFAN